MAGGGRRLRHSHRGQAPWLRTASRRDAKETKKLSDLRGRQASGRTASGDDRRAFPSGLGYYTFTAHTVDKAGNASEKITRTALHDPVTGTPPTGGPVVGVIVGSFDNASRYSVSLVTVTDNLSIKDYWAEMRFGTGDLDVMVAITITDGLFLAAEKVR